jgi:FtsP/CotA-like multicopper oxidase with cupredoxin domain
MRLNRRRFLQSSLILACTSQTPRWVLAADPAPGMDYQLIVEPAEVNLVDGGTTPAWCFNGGYPAPVLRARQHQPIRIRVINRLNEATTIHWHGLRVPITMDGVPFLSQPPIQPGQHYDYEFTPPDAGTFWYHPHMNSIEQLGKGLVGAIIVEEAKDPGFDAELVLGIKNWHINPDGSFSEMTTPRNAFRMGTPGRLQTVNGLQHPSYEVPAGGSVRLRFLNLDNTLSYRLNSNDPQALILAIDGNPIAEPRPLSQHHLGPGMRLDIGLMAPANVGDRVTFMHRNKPLVTVRSIAGQVGSRAVPRLPLNPIAEPDLANAETVQFAFEWDASINPVDHGGTVNHNFWTINRRAWDGMSHSSIPAPLARLQRGKTYIFELNNLTQYHHPIHLHGHTFRVLESNKKAITPFHTDTILLGKNERVRAAFVADNPGRWMYHCHVIEHLKTGLMGYIEVA